MKQRKKTLIIFAALLVVCLAAYIVVTVKTKEPAAEEEETASQTVLGKMDTDAINSIRITYGGETNTFEKSGDGKWTLSADPAFPLDLDQIDKMINVLDDIRATTVVTRNPTEQELNQFGFDKPTCVIEAGDADGNTATYTFGELNSFNSQYYMRTTYTQGIFMETQAFTKLFFKALNTFAVPDTVPAMLSRNISQVAVEKDGVRTTLERYDAQSPQVYTDSYSFVVSSADPILGADNDLTAALLASLTTVRAASCWKYNAGQADFEACGLADGIHVTASYVPATGDTKTAKTFDITIGGAYDDASTYIRVGDSSMICLAATSSVQAVLDFDPALIAATDDVCLVSLASIDAITVTAGGAQYLFTVERKGEHTADYYLNGKKLDSNAFKSLFTTITGLKSEALDEDAGTAAAEPSVTVVIKRNTAEYAELTLELIPYGADSYVARFGGMQNQIVLKAEVDKILNALKAL